MEKRSSCEICGDPHTVPYHHSSYGQCQKCSVAFQNPMHSSEELQSRYKTYYGSENCEPRSGYSDYENSR